MVLFIVLSEQNNRKPFDDESTLVQIMVRSRQATSHDLAGVDANLCHHPALLKGIRPVLGGFVVTMHEGACEQEAQIRGR